MQVPSNNMELSDAIQEMFNIKSLVARFCEDGCQSFAQAESSSSIKLVDETEFFIVILTRAVETLDGYELVEDDIIATNEVLIR